MLREGISSLGEEIDLTTPAMSGTGSGPSSPPTSPPTPPTKQGKSQAPPEPKVPKNIFSPLLTLADVDEEEIARQLTLLDFEMYNLIQVRHVPYFSIFRPFT